MSRRIKLQSIKQILRLHYEQQLSNEKIALCTKVSKGTVYNTIAAFKKANLQWPLEPEISSENLQGLMFNIKSNKKSDHEVDVQQVLHELSKPNVTFQILWEEYHEKNPNGLKRTAFYNRIKAYQGSKPEPIMRQVFKAGDKLFIDYSGDGPSYIDADTGETRNAQLFVASWGASSYTYVEATDTQQQQDFIMSHCRAFSFFERVPCALVPDCLKSAVIKPSLYDPQINMLYQKMAEHYQTYVVPARSRKPTDKALVESNVLHIQRFILGRLRDKTFFSLAEVNEAILPLVILFNERPMKEHQNSSRLQRYIELDKQYAKDLPTSAFKLTKIKAGVLVHFNYHILFDEHHYSVPHQYIKQRVDIHQVGEIIEIYHNEKHIARHRKSQIKGQYSTNDSHMPKSHQAVKKAQNPAWHIFRAGEIGPYTSEITKRLLESRKHPEQSFKACMGLMSFAKKYSPQRLEDACYRACKFKSYSYRAVGSILRAGLDKQTHMDLSIESKKEKPINHDNIRGASFFTDEGAQKDAS